MKKQDLLTISGKEFHSRIFTGTGKYSSPKIMKDALKASGSEMVTVALRRVDLKNPEDHILNHLNRNLYLLLPNTSGAANADEAIRLANLSRASGLSNWIKLEVTPEPRYLLPDGEETLKAAKALIKDGFIVLPYIQADPILARKLEDLGVATIMPLASPIGSNKGIRYMDMLKIIINQANIPVVIDAGLGKPSDAALAMELGASAVLVNTAIATASNPKEMAEAFKLATIAGRKAYLSGLSDTSDIATASSPLNWLI